MCVFFAAKMRKNRVKVNEEKFNQFLRFYKDKTKNNGKDEIYKAIKKIEKCDGEPTFTDFIKSQEKLV